MLLDGTEIVELRQDHLDPSKAVGFCKWWLGGLVDLRNVMKFTEEISVASMKILE